ncbi:uncharacterized protein LOC118818262 [Colossoma macropomum]|uniref:uncharacterized protein LOC118818262 n=1 Tax=Colossoma macropomum TaxID=42526 RepID=UPI001864AD51|nr:uncharacterized protein LOC118818262 [Colossoma macropomum]
MDAWCFTIYILLVMTVSVSSAEDDPPVFRPAQILGSKTAKIGGDIRLKCVIFDSTGSSHHMYLCKNSVGVRLKVLGHSDEHIFILRNVSVLDSGNYTCVYSLNKYVPDDVTASGYNTIHVQVTGVQLVKSAVLRSGRSTVEKGEDIELTCSISESEKPQLLHVYVCKDGLGKISKSLYNQSHSHFSIKNVNLEDSGVYSCVYSATKYNISEVTDTERGNSILIQVYDPQWQINFTRLLCSFGVVIFACLIVVYDVYSTKRRFKKIQLQSSFQSGFT